MIAFELYVNGQKVCTAGSDGLAALTTAVVFSRPKQPAQREAGTYLTVGGVIIHPQEFHHWDHRQLQVGDKIEIRIIETSKVDAPKSKDTPGSCAV